MNIPQLKNPCILFPWNHITPPPPSNMIIEIVEKEGATIRKLNYLDPDIDPPSLKAEIMDILNNLNQLAHSADSSLSQKILRIAEQKSYPVIQKIIHKVKAAIANTQGLLLPGGQDIQPLFYSQEPHPETFKTDDLRRDVFECAMLKEADEKQLPIFGICRGMQLCNVWYGGSLHQHVENHRNVLQTYQICKTLNRGAIARVFESSRDGLKGDSRHHQSIDRIGKNLSVMCVHEDGTIKALEHLDKRFIVLVQWHPESIQNPEKSSLLSTSNLELFAHFIQAAKAFKMRESGPAKL